MAVTVNTLKEMKQSGEKFTCLTSYDATFAQLVSSAGVEVILIGDSLGMVLQGNDSTLPVTIEDMAYHTQCVANGNQGALLMADMPFMSYATPEQAMETAAVLMQSGAHMVKLEGGDWLVETTRLLSERGIPTCLHLGLTPQTVNKMGGYKVQGRQDQQADKMITDAVALAEAGADIILLECVPYELADKITKAVDVPVIGIGAGNQTDGQVLVIHDMLGATTGHRPKFVKNFLEGNTSIQAAIENYITDVKSGAFPSEEHTFK
ncbi:3-methyl-2-oxobutanoate hydroxymethyltransferase [Litoribrevibacter albus]|uniref:3-methyl-2-oxobutanoate hydroxymethyltransferase n=1 Tax=Litoribrevibacter albus TaxID=1473156 RepID=A0AA37SG30_9GAMM|nr:3-methyl-2-oxobutanoate hydroxymethyltransferase [Litoribrevibacter albus]GLQ33665.1 3-methyl-2-oxobutanoate hydroxymethyltransferase [Litoribrevibacter albus]